MAAAAKVELVSEKPVNQARSSSNSSPSSPSEQHKDGSADEENQTAWAKVNGFLWPAWLAAAVKDQRMWKNWFRCMVATFVSFILILDRKALNTLGQAAFFCLIVSQMLAPAMALTMFVFAMLTLGIGMLLGWAWGCATMAAALRARSQVLYARQLETVYAGFNHNANIDVQYQQAIFHGRFLDPRSSAVYGVFFFIGAYTFGFLRASKPKLTLLAIFGTIILDVMTSYGALFPFAQYTLGRILLVPAACYMAIAVLCSLLIFPQSTSHIVLSDLVPKVIGPLRDILSLQDQVLSTPLSETDKWEGYAKKSMGLRKGHIAAVNAIEGQVKIGHLEISRGQIGARDMSKLFEVIKLLGGRAFALSSFVILQEERRQALDKFKEAEPKHSQFRAKREYEKAMESASRSPETDMAGLLPIMEAASADLRAAANKALSDASDWIKQVNDTRWKKVPASAPTIESREANLKTLQVALSEFRESKHFALLEPFRDNFDEQGQLKPSVLPELRFVTREMFRCHVFTTTLVAFCLAEVEMLELLLDIERRNPTSRFQLPGLFGKMLIKAVNAKDGNNGNVLDMGSKVLGEDDGTHLNETGSSDSSETLVDSDTGANDKASKEKQKKKPKTAKEYPKDPDALAPRNGLHRFARSIHQLWHHLISPSGIFALKYGLVSIALWIPQVCPSSAWFVYTNRGLWALIMSQTGLGVFTGEQIFSFVQRAAGTGMGLVIGMVAWYLGAQKTNGTPYGVAAATMCLIAPTLFIRLAAPPQQMAFWLMVNVTIMFVVGYSWVDGHVFQLANQGTGAGLAGRRALLVLIGFAAAFVIMLIPRPLSARQIVRRNLARSLSETGELFSEVITGLEEEEGHGMEKKQILERANRHRARFLAIMGRMGGLMPLMGYAGMEPGLKGPWPKKQYTDLFALQGSLLGSLALLSLCYSRLNKRWSNILATRAPVMNPAFIADCLALFTLMHQSLRAGTPLPPTIPLFERLSYHTNLRKPVRIGVNTHGRTEVSASDPSTHQEQTTADDMSVLENEQALENLDEPLTWEMAHDEQLAIYASANVALIHLVGNLDKIQQIVVDLCGEKELKGFDEAQTRLARTEEV